MNAVSSELKIVETKKRMIRSILKGVEQLKDKATFNKYKSRKK